MALRSTDALHVWLDALFPPRCAGCGRLGDHFCAACVATVKPVRPPWCASCGASLPERSGAGPSTVTGAARCAACRSRPLPLAAVRSAGVLEGPLRTAIHRLKYRGRRSAARALGELLVPPARALRSSCPGIVVAPRAEAVEPPASSAPTPNLLDPLVIPIPLHPRRERERGYNQSALLAAALERSLGWRIDRQALRRVKDTAPLVRLPGRERAAMMAGAFAAARRLDGVYVLLVDDVMTTGSTLADAARACLTAGAASVAGLTLARER